MLQEELEEINSLVDLVLTYQKTQQAESDEQLPGIANIPLFKTKNEDLVRQVELTNNQKKKLELTNEILGKQIRVARDKLKELEAECDVLQGTPDNARLNSPSKQKKNCQNET